RWVACGGGGSRVPAASTAYTTTSRATCRTSSPTTSRSSARSPRIRSALAWTPAPSWGPDSSRPPRDHAELAHDHGAAIGAALLELHVVGALVDDFPPREAVAQLIGVEIGPGGERG